MKPVIVYSTKVCPYCRFAKELLNAENIPFEEIFVDQNEEDRKKMERLSGRKSVPQIFIGERHVGGFDDLKALFESGQLHEWL